MKKAADEVGGDNAKSYGKLAERCRSVAGTQDDLARDLSIRVIRLTEQAARIAVQSPQHAQMAAEVIVKARQLLRKPTWWEPPGASCPSRIRAIRSSELSCRMLSRFFRQSRPRPLGCGLTPVNPRPPVYS